MQLVYVDTSDGLTLEGLYWPAGGPKARLGAVLVHGWTFWHDMRVRSRGFCGKNMASIATHLSQGGIPTVLTMNRGFHAPEFFNDCVIDFEASIDFLVSQGCEEIVILGHSLGGAKCAYFAGEVGHPRLRGVVLMSAIPSTYNFSGKEGLVAEAQRCIVEGRPDTVIPFQEGKTTSLNHAETLVRSLTEGYRGTTLEAVSKISLPTLSIAAEREWEWFQRVTRGILASKSHPENIKAVLLSGVADHGYSNHEEAVAIRIADWIKHTLLS
jgi:pimeloyl-ACP methyl ester carboxylesterase